MGKIGDWRRKNRRRRRENRVWNDQTWFWEDEDRSEGALGAYGKDTEGIGTSDEDVQEFIKDMLEMYGENYFQNILTGLQEQAEEAYGWEDMLTAGEYAGQAEDLVDDYQSIEDWMAANEYAFGTTEEEQRLIAELAALLSDPNAAWGDAAKLHGAELAGFGTTDAFQAAKEAMNARLTGENALENYEGMSEAERQLRDRQNRSNLRESEARAQRIVQNTMADTGSTARMLAQADEATRQISNIQIQQDVALAQEDFERQYANMQQEMQMYQQYLNAGQVGYTDYLQMQTAGVNSAVAAYTAKINAIMGQNQQYLQMHQADQDAILNQFNSLMSLSSQAAGITAAVQNMIDQAFQRELTAISARIDAFIAANELSPDVIGDLFEVLTTITGIVTSVLAVV